MKGSDLSGSKLADDLLWGGKAIGEEIGMEEKPTLYHLERKHLPGRKVGNLWVSSRSELRRALRTPTNMPTNGTQSAK